MKSQIRLSDHFGFTRLMRYTFPSIVMMIFTSLYGVADGANILYANARVSNFRRAYTPAFYGSGRSLVVANR